MLFKKKQEITNARNNVEKIKPQSLLVGMWVGTITGENRVEVAQKIKNKITIGSGNPTSNIFPKREKTHNLKETSVFPYSLQHYSL